MSSPAQVFSNILQVPRFAEAAVLRGPKWLGGPRKAVVANDRASLGFLCAVDDDSNFSGLVAWYDALANGARRAKFTATSHSQRIARIRYNARDGSSKERSLLANSIALPRSPARLIRCVARGEWEWEGTEATKVRTERTSPRSKTIGFPGEKEKGKCGGGEGGERSAGVGTSGLGRDFARCGRRGRREKRKNSRACLRAFLNFSSVSGKDESRGSFRTEVEAVSDGFFIILSRSLPSPGVVSSVVDSDYSSGVELSSVTLPAQSSERLSHH